MRLRTFGGLLAVALVALSGCDSTSQGKNGERNLILSGPPAAGYSLALDQTLSQQVASNSTPADPRKTLAQLQGDGYAAGWARTWTKGVEDVEILEFAFGDEFHSRDFVHFDLLEIGKGAGVMAAPHPTVPDSTIFTFNGKTRVRPRQVFCQGAWFVVVQYAFEVTDCGAAPPFPNLMADTAQQSYVAATAALGLPAALVSPSTVPSNSP